MAWKTIESMLTSIIQHFTNGELITNKIIGERVHDTNKTMRRMGEKLENHQHAGNSVYISRSKISAERRKNEKLIYHARTMTRFVCFPARRRSLEFVGILQDSTGLSRQSSAWES